MDPLFSIKPIQYPTNPNQIVYLAMHQDYSSSFVAEEEIPSEEECGKSIIKNLLKGGRGHYGPLEHPSYTFLCGYFPHSTMVQLRTHRTGISFDVQSFRYTSAGLINAANEMTPIEKVVYFRPLGFYSDRQGNKYEYTQEDLEADKVRALRMLKEYAYAISKGRAEEHARSLAPTDLRQHFVVSANARTLGHLFDLRAKLDAQKECQWFCDLMMASFKDLFPTFANWYLENRWQKAKLAP